jgi:hypothetical protein
MPDSSDTLRASIFAAFAARPRPAADAILRPEAGREGDELRLLLAEESPETLSTKDVRAKIEGRLWMLGAESFRYFLPGLLLAALDPPGRPGPFAEELVDALTEPSRQDIEDMLDRIGRAPAQARLDEDVAESLQQQLLTWFDSGAPEAVFRDRFDDITQREGAAILSFLDRLRAENDSDFLEESLDRAESRFWSRFRRLQ